MPASTPAVTYDLQGHPPVTHSTTEAPPASTAQSPPPLSVSVNGMAAMLGISQREAYRLLDDRTIESRYLGRRRLVPVASIEAFLASLPTERD